MFCPNCGTENEEAATTCKKCGFNLKGAAAPKFKGTMLMMNSPAMPKAGAPTGPAASPAVPPPPAFAPPAAPPAAAPAMAPRPQLKGTMLGVAPPSLGAPVPPGAPPGFGPPPGAPNFGPPPAAPPGFGPPPGAPPGFGPPPGAPNFGPPPAQPPQAFGPPLGYPQPGFGSSPGQGYGPPAGPPYGPPPGAPPAAPPPQPTVNPLGGTMVADPSMGGFNPYGQPNPYGPPPPAQPGNPYGSPPPAQPAQPANPYGSPPGGYGTPGPLPGGYGAPHGDAYRPSGQAPQQSAYGPPPGAGYGQAPAQPQYGAPPGVGYNAPPAGGYGAPGGFSPPLDQYGISGGAPLVAMGGGGQRGPIGKVRNPVLTAVLSCVCFVYAIVQIWGMLNELKAFRGKDDLNPILFFVPILGYVELWKLNQKVLDAKHMAGVPNPQVASPVVYLFLALFFLPGDLNEIWQAANGGQLPPAS